MSEVSCNGSCLEYSVHRNDHMTKSSGEARPDLKHVRVWMMVCCRLQEDCKHLQEFVILLKIISEVSNECGNQ